MRTLLRAANACLVEGLLQRRAEITRRLRNDRLPQTQLSAEAVRDQRDIAPRCRRDLAERSCLEPLRRKPAQRRTCSTRGATLRRDINFASQSVPARKNGISRSGSLVRLSVHRRDRAAIKTYPSGINTRPMKPLMLLTIHRELAATARPEFQQMQQSTATPWMLRPSIPLAHDCHALASQRRLLERSQHAMTNHGIVEAGCRSGSIAQVIGHHRVNLRDVRRGSCKGVGNPAIPSGHRKRPQFCILAKPAGKLQVKDLGMSASSLDPKIAAPGTAPPSSVPETAI